MILVSDWKWRC